MNERDTKVILRALFETQIEDDPDAAPDEHHYMAMLRDGRPWTAADRAMLLRSPRARLTLEIAVERLRIGLLSQWRDHGWSEAVPLPLAASSADESHIFRTAFYDLQLDRSGPAEWVVTLSLGRDLMAAVAAAPNLAIRLCDDAGRVWIEGRPDRHGALSGFWPWPGESPMQRLALHPLRLMPAVATPPTEEDGS